MEGGSQGTLGGPVERRLSQGQAHCQQPAFKEERRVQTMTLRWNPVCGGEGAGSICREQGPSQKTRVLF